MRSSRHAATRSAALLAALAATTIALPAHADDHEDEDPVLSKGAFSGLKFRSVGPASCRAASAISR
jgi:hypothetical protein